MIILVYNADGSKDALLLLRQRDAAANADIHLAKNSHLRVLDGSTLSDVGSILDKRLPLTIEEFDRLFPDQPAIVK